MRAKKWLRGKLRDGDRFEYSPQEGGYMGSLAGLGFVVDLKDGKAAVTESGKDWAKWGA